MLKKIKSTNLYILNDFEKRQYINFEDENIYWNKKKKQFVSTVPKFIIINNNKELLTGTKITYLNFNTYQEGLLVDKSDLEEPTLKELLIYLNLVTTPINLNCYLCKLNNFIKKSIKQEICLQRARK